MEFEGRGPLLKPLLLIGGSSSRMGTRKELLLFPDGRSSFEHAVEALNSAVPSAKTIYVSFHDSSQVPGIQPALDRLNAKETMRATDDDHHQNTFPKLELIFDGQEKEIGPAAGLAAAHTADPNAKWLVLGCDYPLLPASALQQLILEYQDPVTCFQNDSGLAEPLLAIWSCEALGKLKENVGSGKYGLNHVIKDVAGKLVRPLREEWISGTNTKEEWDGAMKVLASRVTAW